MKSGIRTLILGVLATAITVAYGAEPTLHELKKAERAKLQGEWALVSAGKGDFSIAPEVAKRVKRVTSGKETVLLADGKELMRATFKLDPTKTPKTIDYKITGGTHQGEAVFGIYDVTGDTLKLSYAAPGKQRPTDFDGKPGDQHVFAVWQKAVK